MSLLSSQIADTAAKHGLMLMRVVDINELQSSVLSEQQRLAQWQESGFAGQMQYMQRDAELFFDFEKFLPGVKTILSFTIPYSNAVVGATPEGHGRIARYAWGRDYHKVLKKRMKHFSRDLSQSHPSISTRAFTDAVPILERFIAQSGGQGFIGKNTLHIIPGFGSMSFLCEVFIDDTVVNDAGDSPELQKASSCGSCRRCIDSCPTQAFPKEYVLDANRCISYLTIEFKESFSGWQRQALGDWLFGCDICQEVCPFNHKNVQPRQDLELIPCDGNGPFLSLKEIFKLQSPEEFLERFAGTPLMRAGYTGLTRNAAAVVANTKNFELAENLISLLERDSAIIQDAAISALSDLVVDGSGLDKRKIENALKMYKVRE